MVSVCLPSDALLEHLPSYLGCSYLGCGVPLHGCSSKAQPPLLTLDEGYLLTATPPDLGQGVAPLSPLVPAQPLLLGLGVAPLGCHPDTGLRRPGNIKKWYLLRFYVLYWEELLLLVFLLLVYWIIYLFLID